MVRDGGVEPASELRGLVQQLFRRFGVLAADRTPCGNPLPIAQAHTLMLLLESQPLTQQALAAALHIDKSNVARLCSKLSAAGHIEQQVGDDARQRLVRLTPSGRRLAKQVERASQQRFQEILRNMPPHTREQLLPVLQDLVRSIELLPSPSEPES
ncbi:MAG: winged helix-turn-helix transcriptional regulator [Myxococcales bacterium]|nr:winged helix-turn-helix transcriptional regulator [Myxococcales bacterium]MCB9606776.1 winged helix-turn-helix transcriptional regulator [Polyangiaceae bacterium]